MPVTPISGLKMDIKAADYARQKLLKYAQVPLNDGTSLQVLSNVNNNASKKLPVKYAFLHVIGDELIGVKAYSGSEKGAASFFEHMVSKFQDLVNKGTNIAEVIFEQFSSGLNSAKKL